MGKKIVVIGSSNTDMVVKAKYFPQPGETILGGDFFVFQGGKGANQSVAAARLDGNVSFIGKVGNDSFGNAAVLHYQKEGIDTRFIKVVDEAATGVALITLNEEGENTIVVASGANSLLSVEDLLNADGLLTEAEWFITQLETPLPVIEFLANYTRVNSKKLILNPAPAATLPDSVYDGLYLITPNETETEILTGIAVNDEISVQEAVSSFRAKGVKNVVITMGSKGAYVYTNEFKGFIEAYEVEAIDTTAAGDVFNGGLVVALSEGRGWEESVRFACKSAAVAVTRMGAQASAPFRKEIDLINL